MQFSVFIFSVFASTLIEITCWVENIKCTKTQLKSGSVPNWETSAICTNVCLPNKQVRKTGYAWLLGSLTQYSISKIPLRYVLDLYILPRLVGEGFESFKKRNQIKKLKFNIQVSFPFLRAFRLLNVKMNRKFLSIF